MEASVYVRQALNHSKFFYACVELSHFHELVEKEAVLLAVL